MPRPRQRRRRPRWLLLDTHVLLWWLLDDARLSDENKQVIDDELEVHVSSVVLWEVAIKQALGKLTVPEQDLVERISDCDFYPLPVEFEHAVEVARLPLIHRDPFDRMLVAQARCERLTILTGDPNIRAYDVPVLVP